MSRPQSKKVILIEEGGSSLSSKDNINGIPDSTNQDKEINFSDLSPINSLVRKKTGMMT